MAMCWIYTGFVFYLAVLFIVVETQETSREKPEGTDKNPITVTVTMPSLEDNSTLDETMGTQGASTGLIVGVVCGVVLLLGLIVLVVTIWIRRKRQRDIEFERAAKVQRSSANTAGVYVDLATDTPIVKKPLALNDITEMDRLRNDDDEIA